MDHGQITSSIPGILEKYRLWYRRELLVDIAKLPALPNSSYNCCQDECCSYERGSDEYHSLYTAHLPPAARMQRPSSEIAASCPAFQQARRRRLADCFIEDWTA